MDIDAGYLKIHHSGASFHLTVDINTETLNIEAVQPSGQRSGFWWHVVFCKRQVYRLGAHSHAHTQAHTQAHAHTRAVSTMDKSAHGPHLYNR